MNEINIRTNKWGVRQSAVALAVCFVLSFCCITIVSKTSFLYVFHDGTDINWFLTVGRGIVNGKVPYKDLFEQKGILLYLLFALNYLVCGNNYALIYIIQIVCFAVFLFLSLKIILLYKPIKYAYIGTVCVALIVCCCHAFSSGGGEVEEYCLPMLAYGLYTFLLYVRGGGKGIPAYRVVMCGIFSGCIFWMKYTVLVYYAVFAVCVFVDRCIKRDVLSAFAYAAMFIGGFVVISLPCLIYLGANGAIGDMWQVYIVTNIFSYTGGRLVLGFFSRIGSSLKEVLRNFILYIFAINGAFYFVRTTAARRYKIYLLLSFAAVFVIQCLLNGDLCYYHLAIAMFVPLGIAGAGYTFTLIYAAASYVIKKIKANGKGGISFAGVAYSAKGSIAVCRSGIDRKLKTGANVHTVVVCVASVVAICLIFGNNTLELFYGKDRYPHFDMAEYIDNYRGDDEDDSVLCYKILEYGFYAPCDETPEFYYFALNNLEYEAYPEIYDEMESYVLGGKPRYVVTEVKTWNKEMDTCLALYGYVMDLSYSHVESNTEIYNLKLCLLKLK